MIMILTSMPVHSLAANVNHNDLSESKSEIINNITPVKVAKPETGKMAADLIKNPDQPKIYTLRTDYKVQRGEKYQVDYQPYIASVGAAATQAEKDKVNKPIVLPDIAGYKEPQKDFTINYDKIVEKAKEGTESKDSINGDRYSANQDFKYAAKSNRIKVKHVFQNLEDFTKYTNPDGSTDDKHARYNIQRGNTGSTMQVEPLDDSEIKGFIPEAEYINMQVPENAEDFILEYRYNRAHYDVVFDTQGGTALPARTLYYGQEMPKIVDADIPTKVGGEFQGWKPSVDLKGTLNGVERTFKANEIIKVGTNEASKNLDANLIMPASKVTFTAVWKNKEKADYAVQFWAEKSDHADDASLLDKYDYIGTRVYKDQATGSRPDLDNETVNGLKFPDLDQRRLNKIWAGARFNRTKNLYLNKFYVYNQDLTHDQNKDPANVNLVKSVDSTGKTVYNIYYDRQVYDLYFTKSNAQPDKNTFYPEIYGRDQKKNELVKLGGPGNLYHYKARFNELMYGWPNDAMQTKGFTEGYQSFGWGPNYAAHKWPVHLDTPPYRLNADEFLDMTNYDNWGGYTKHIDKGDGTSIDLDQTDFTTLSFGIKQEKPSIPHHMDFWMDGFKDGETIIRYDLVRTKADTSDPKYTHKYPIVTGFTPYASYIQEENQEDGRVNEGRIDELNDEREEITPYPGNGQAYYNIFGFNSRVGELKFIPAFFSNSDEFGDPLGGKESGFKENGYLQFHYKRNKYPLRFNYDPSKIKDDSEFNKTNSLDTFYQFPLKVLSPDLVDGSLDREKKEYFKEDPKNFIDNPENLQKLGLKDLVFTDLKDGKLKVKRPDNLSDQMVFKGWALDPAGTKLVWENSKETMPFHPLNLYAKWGEPDYKWKVTFDPNGGNLSSIDEAKVTQKRKTIQVGDKGQEETKTFAQKEKNDGDKQVFTVIQRQKLVEPPKPTKKGYDFMGWEAIRYTKDAKGDYTDEIDNSYRETYKVPELYTFGNDVVSPIYLKAIWTPNNRVDVDIVHHILNLDLSKETKKITETLSSKRAGNLVATSGDKQNEKYILATHKDLEEKLTGDLKKLYEEYNGRVKADNTYFQTFKVEPEKIDDGSGNLIDNPKFKDNVFHFFYRPFRTRDYKVNYIDERGKAEVEKFFKGLNLTDTSGLKDDALLKANEENNKKFEDKRTDFEKLIKKYQIIAPEAVSDGNRHYDARNYRPIPGWKLVSDPQQQLFFDVNEKTNEFLGINGTGSDQIFFYYKDVRVIEVPGDKEPPEGYVRVTFKADKGGSFGKDAEGKDITELNYDVIKGLKSDLLPVPEELGTKADGTPNDKVEGKYYITPETGKKFIKWDEKPLLNNNTIVDNDKKGFYVFTAKFEWSGLSASGLVRTEAFKDPNNKWTNDFSPKIEDLKKQLVWMEKGEKKDLPAGAKIQLFDEAGNELTKDKQVYDLVNEKKKADNDELIRTVKVKAKVTFTDGKDPQELDIPIKVYKNVYEALTTGKKPLFLSEAEKGDLKDITGEYVKVTVAPTGDMSSKDNKVYYANPKAWVDIPEVKPNGSSTLINWTADKVGQNENNAANGKFDFAKRHKFTEATIISPRFSQTSELVAHESYKDSKNNWVNDFIDKELTEDKLKAAVQVKNGVAKALGDGDKVTIVDDAGKPYADDAALKAALYEKLKEKDDGVQPSRTENIKVKVTFASGEVQTLTIPVKVIKNIYEAKTKEGKPDYVPDNYVKVTLDPTTKAKVPQKYFYYVNPDANVLIPGKDPEGVKEAFTRWTMKKDSSAADVAGETYKLKDRHQFKEDSTIRAQYEEGKIKIIYVDDNGKEINRKYHIAGVDYPSEKFGKLNTAVNEIDLGDAKTVAPKFKGYFYTSRDSVKDKNYKEPANPDKLDVVKYHYTKKVTTDDKSTSKAHFPVVFDANTGEFGSNPKGKKTVYVYCDGSGKTPEPVTFEEVRQEVEEKYGKPSKANENFIEWQTAATDGTKVEKNYVIKLKDRDNGETFYANYGKASALVKYLDLNGNSIADGFKFLTDAEAQGLDEAGKKAALDKKYPTEKAGTADEAIPSDVFTKDKAPKFTGYKFNRIELNPKDGKYALSKKATIKIYYEKDLDVIPAEDGTKNPDGYVEVKFVPTDKAKDKTEKIFYVNPKKDVTIPIADPVAKATFTFDKWKIGKDAKGDDYNPKTPKKFTDALTTITATYTSSKNIIPYDPSATDPMPKPEGYVRVTFAADDGLKLTEQKAYYVKKNAKNAAGKSLTLGDAELAKPAYEAQTGNKFDKWDTADDTEIKETDIVVTAKATILKDVDTVNHPGYVRVTFKAGANGVIKENGNKINEKVYYVNPAKYVNLTPPTTVPNTSYEFSTWESDDKDFILANNINYTKDTIITAKFNTKGDVIPKTKPDDSQKPKGFVTVTFVIDPTEAGKIKDGQTTTYFVRPNTDLTIQPPKTTANTGYEFEKWNLDTTEAKKYTTDTIVKGEFKKLVDIIPSKNPDGTVNAKPEGYVIVNFLKGDYGVLDGRTTFYVNPKAGKKLKDLDTKGITVVPSPTYKHDGWDTDFETVIDKDTKVTAKYTQLPNIIKAGPKDTAPDGYVVIIFETDGRGTITGNPAYEKTPPAGKENEIVYFVNPKKGIKLAKLADGATPADDQLAIPSTTPNDSTKYIFDQWRTDIDTTTPITRGRVHIAMFKPKVVKLTYNANGAKGDVPPELKVDYDADVRLAGKGNLAKKDSSFKGWKIGDKIYQAGDRINLREDTTAYAQWDDDKNIIPYDPVNNPTTRPDDTYVRVTFAVEDGLKLKEQKAYYVKKDAGIKLGDTNLAKPGYTVETGYEFDKWDKEDSLVITTDITVTAKSTKLGTVIPEKDKNGNTNAKPTGYKEVVFKVKDEDQSKGTLEGNTKFYVNPTEYVTINPPATKAETGYKFGTWGKDATIPTVYADDVTTIEGSFNGLKDIIPKTNPDGTENNKPAGYKTVTFVIEGRGGSVVKDEVTVYYVNQDKDVTVPQPKTLAQTGYEFEKWDQDTTTAKKYDADLTVKGNFKKLDDIVDGNKPKPDGYITVTFDKGEHGTISGQKVYFVNPKANPAKTLGDSLIKKPKVSPETGYKFTSWDKEDTVEIKGPEDILVRAQYTALDDVIVKTADDDSQKPDGYIKVTFDTVDKGKGTIGSTIITKKVLFVNPNKSHVLRLYAPKVTTKTGYDFADWDTQIDKRIQYSDGDTIKALYNEKGDVIPQKNPNGSDRPADYIKVLFDKGEHGELRGKTVYYVNPNKEVTVPAPTVKASVGYEFSKWNKALRQKFTEDTRITAAYKPLADIVPQGKTDGSDKPYGYHTVTFKADANGSLTGNTVYYVNPEKHVELTDTAKAITKNPNIGYTAEGGTWDKGLNAKFNDGDVITFNFKALPNVIAKTKDDESEKPDGYITVTLIPTGKEKDATNKVYFVNPKAKNVTITNKPEGKKEKVNKIDQTYTFKGWKVTKGTIASWDNEQIKGTFIQDTEITAQYSTKLDAGIIVPALVAKKNVVTPKGDKPTPEDLIENKTGLPEGTTFKYTDDGTPDVKNPGKTTAKVEVKYPNGKIVVVEVPITVVDHVIPQTGTEKPKDVPNNFVQVKFVPTDKATDSTAKIFWVNPDKEVTISVSNPTGKQHFTFKEWKLGVKADGAVYTPSTPKKFTAKETVITATYTEAENIIPYNPSEPITTPDGYVRVTFEADDGLTLPNVKYYYVKKNSGVTLAKLTKPNVKPKVGFEFKNWDKENSLKIEDKDVVVKAKSTPIADAIEGKPGVEKPDGYVEVKFVAGENGTVTEKTYYVNPTKYVKLTPPTAKGNTGFEFGSWSQNAEIPTQYTEKLTTITASFNPVDSVIPKTEDGQQKPDGYVTVNFVIKGKGGQIADGETITYFVNPNEEVTIPQPKTKSEIGYEFEAWDIDTTAKAKYTKETTVTGNFRKLEDIIPSTDEKGKPNAQPEGYVTVSFDKGANGNLTGQTSYFVNPNAGKKLSDITKPTVAPEIGYKFRSWDTDDSLVIKADKTVTAQYDKSTDVIPKTKDDYSEKPAGYIEVTFDTTEKGKIKDSTAKTKVVFVNPNKALVLKGFAPEVVANKGYEFERWDASIEKPIQYNDGDTIKAIYKPGVKPGDKPGNKPGTTPAQPGGTTPGKPEKHGHRYIERVAGKDRVHTAINTSRRFFNKSRYVIIADSGNYPDALTATVLAHVLDAPILLNNTRYLEDDVAREIVRLGASEVIIVGGHKSISENVKSQLAKYDQNKVQRIWGRDRYVTSSELAYEIQRLTGKVNKAIIASGENFPDALATAPLGSKEIAPILLVKRNQMDMKVSKALKDLNIKRVYVAGGQNSVSKKLEAQLPQVIRRFSGQDRYETAILVASYTYPDSKEVFVASGEVFPDALVIGPVCARRKAPILLSKSTPVKVTDDYIEKSKIEYLYIIGGTNTIYAETAHKYAIEE